MIDFGEPNYWVFWNFLARFRENFVIIIIQARAAARSRARLLRGLKEEKYTWGKPYVLACGRINRHNAIPSLEHTPWRVCFRGASFVFFVFGVSIVRRSFVALRFLERTSWRACFRGGEAWFLVFCGVVVPGKTPSRAWFSGWTAIRTYSRFVFDVLSKSCEKH